MSYKIEGNKIKIEIDLNLFLQKVKEGNTEELVEPISNDSLEEYEKIAKGINESVEDADGIDLFDEAEVGGNTVGGQIGNQEAREIANWCGKNNIQIDVFSKWLRELKSVGGKQLSSPVIGTRKGDGKPSLYMLAKRYHGFWLQRKESVLSEYFSWLGDELKKIDVAKDLIKSIFNGAVEVDPETLNPLTNKK